MESFDDIRPYYDSEIPAAMKSIAESSALPILASYVFPDKPIDDVRKLLCSFQTIRDFQLGVMYHVNKQIIHDSITAFTCHGVEQLEKGKAYLFVSNHRDIMLDASLLQNVLADHGMDTSEITFGANLMMNQLVVDIGRSNKMFKVERPGGSIREFYKSSHHLSDYIRQCITVKGQSAWIAQRNGRTKNGQDRTDQGIIKMFCMSMPTDKIRAIAELNVVPVSVSYEWETCDVLKTLELYESQFAKYTKKPGEDLNSILTGVLQPKGRVHFEVGAPLTQNELSAFEQQTNNEYHRSVAHLLDQRIISGYRLFPNNFIAYDLLFGTTKYKDNYTVQDFQNFNDHLAELQRYDTCDLERLTDIFLSIYANPVIDKTAL